MGAQQEAMHRAKRISMQKKRIILASGSPRRKELLQREGIAFEVRVSGADEFDAQTAKAPRELPQANARQKGHAVFAGLSAAEQGESIVIAADTMVFLGDAPFEKPHDAQDAARMLRELSGKAHQVITGVCLESAAGQDSFECVTDVHFKDLSDEQIAAYVATGEPLDKAGAYGIQGKGGELVDHIDGDFDNVVGLPMAMLLTRLARA